MNKDLNKMTLKELKNEIAKAEERSVKESKCEHDWRESNRETFARSVHFYYCAKCCGQKKQIEKEDGIWESQIRYPTNN